MLYKFLFKKIKYSPLKIRFVINKIKYFSIKNILLYLNFFNTKSSFILKKLFFSSLNSLKNNYKLNLENISLNKITSEKGCILKKINIRARGRFDLLRKPYVNIIIIYFNF